MSMDNGIFGLSCGCSCSCSVPARLARSGVRDELARYRELKNMTKEKEACETSSHATYKTYGKNRSLRLKGFDYSTDRAYFITICSDKGRALLQGAIAGDVAKYLKQLREKYLFKVYVYCIMPDHVHLLLAPGDSGLAVSGIIQRFKSLTARSYNSNGGEGKLWQRYFYDHIVRKEEDLNRIALYILENPVRKRLAGYWKDWPYSETLDPIE